MPRSSRWSRPWPRGAYGGALAPRPGRRCRCIWVRVGTELQRVTLEAQSWLLPQLHVILARMGMPSEKVMGSRLEVTSAEAEARLFDE